MRKSLATFTITRVYFIYSSQYQIRTPTREITNFCRVINFLSPFVFFYRKCRRFVVKFTTFYQPLHNADDGILFWTDQLRFQSELFLCVYTLCREKKLTRCFSNKANLLSSRYTKMSYINFIVIPEWCTSVRCVNLWQTRSLFLQTRSWSVGSWFEFWKHKFYFGV